MHVYFFLSSCNTSNPIVEKIIANQQLSEEEQLSYEKNKKAIDELVVVRKKELLKTAIIEKLALDKPLNDEEKKEYASNAENFNKSAAVKKEALTNDGIVKKIANGDQMTASEVEIYQKNKQSLDSAVDELRGKKAKEEIITKLVRNIQLTAEENKKYVDNKKEYDELAIGRKNSNQEQMPVSSPKDLSAVVMPSAQYASVVARPVVIADDIYFVRIERIPYIRRQNNER